MGMTSSSSPPSHQILWKQPSLSNKKKTNNSTGAHSSSSFSPNTINHSFISIGTARNTCRHYGGYPYTNAIPSPGDTFIRFVRSKVLGLAIGTDVKSSYRLGRTGLLTEVVLLSVSWMVPQIPREVVALQEIQVQLKRMTLKGLLGHGRYLLLQRILQSDQLTPVWEKGLSSSKNYHPSPVNELLWVYT